MDEEDKADDATQDTPQKTSKRDRLKGALARTRSKFKKQDNKTEETETVLSDDINEFLAAGRTSISSLNTTVHAADTLPHHPTPSFSPSTSATEPQSPRPSTSDSSSLSNTKQSPRKINVPRIDVSNSQRYPSAQPIEEVATRNDFLRPEYQNRSQSTSSLSKGKRRGRGLSVTFIEAPPIVIGVGGDEAPAPPIEISRARARARSVSPLRTGAHANESDHTHNRSPNNHNNIPYGLPTHGPRPSPQDASNSSPLQRVPTGLTPVVSVAKSGLDREFEMSLQLGTGPSPSPSSFNGSNASPTSPKIHAPRPIRPVKPPPVVIEIPENHALKREDSGGDLRTDFREGDVLRTHRDGSVTSPISNGSPQSALSSATSQKDIGSSPLI